MSCILDAASVLEEVRFIENNPIRKEIVGQASDYTWSSARAHVMGVANPVIFDRFPLTAYFPDWRAFLVAGGDEAVIGRARLRLLTGRPAGDLAFIKRLEDIAGRILEVRPRGRPRKTHQ